MQTLQLSPGNTLSYTYRAPAENGFTFVCFNALTGDMGMWVAALEPTLEAAGHGLLVYNLRGQAGSEFTVDRITESMIVDDARALVAHVGPPAPIYVGLSIGGLFAARVHLSGDAPARGLVLLNTLRRESARLAWVNDAILRAAETGGLDLVRDLYAPLLFNDDWLAANRAGLLKPAAETGGYRPLPQNDGASLLLASGGTADWDLPYEDLTLPVLIVTGMQDRIFRDPADIEALEARLPDSRTLDMADAGHMIPAERPADLAKAILEFAREIADRDPAS
ncbi:MAG: alpha/beta fold hydrolase [Pseudomonadota bacterium]